MSDASRITLCPHTSAKSFPHWLTGQGPPGCERPRKIVAYLLVLAVSYVPMLAAALVAWKLGRLSFWNGFKDGSVAFFEDFGFHYALLISLPSLVVLLVSDQHLLATSLEEVQQDKVLVLSASSFDSLQARWDWIFRWLNPSTQIVGVVVGVVLGIVTAHQYENMPEASCWIAHDHKLNIAGYVYVYCISLFYAVIIFYVTRSIAIALFLRAVVKGADSPLSILPLHPDKCGGLRPVGRLGLRNQYTLTILGINLLVLAVVWHFDMNNAVLYRNILIAGATAYVILGPIIFMAPLLPFRAAMQTAKRKWTHEFAAVVRTEINALRMEITTSKDPEIDDKSIERLRKVSAALDELPIWPFDGATLRKFATAYLAPTILLPLLGKLLTAFVALFR